MAKYMAIHRRIWTGSTFRQLSDDGKFAAFYILTSPHGNTEGFYRLPVTFAQYELGWPMERVLEAFEELELKGFAKFDMENDLVLICNALKFNEPKGKNRVTGAVNALAGLPDSFLWKEFFELAEPCDQLREALSEHYPHYVGYPFEAPSKPLRDPFEAPSEGYQESCGDPFEAPSNTPEQTPEQQPTPSSSPTAPAESTERPNRNPTPLMMTDLVLAKLGCVKPAAGPDEVNYVKRAMKHGWAWEHLEPKVAELAQRPANNQRAYVLKSIGNLTLPPGQDKPPEPIPMVTCPDCKGETWDYNHDPTVEGHILPIECATCDNRRRVPAREADF